MKTGSEYMEMAWFKYFADKVEPPFVNESVIVENKKKIKQLNDETEQTALF